MRKLANNTLGTQARIDGLIEIEDLTEELIKYERILDDIDSYDLEIIRQLMVRKKIFIDDLQFMIASDGHIYVTDPIEVIIGNKDMPIDRNLRMIDLLLDTAKQNLLERGQ